MFSENLHFSCWYSKSQYLLFLWSTKSYALTIDAKKCPDFAFCWIIAIEFILLVMVVIYMLDVCRLQKKQGMTKRLWWNFSAWWVRSLISVSINYNLWVAIWVFWYISFQLIRRRYFSDEIPSPAWSVPSVQRPAQRIDENFTEDDLSYNRRRYADVLLSSPPWPQYFWLEDVFLIIFFIHGKTTNNAILGWKFPDHCVQW